MSEGTARVEPPSIRIVNELRRRIFAAELGPGDRLPSTRQITRDWGVAMATAIISVMTGIPVRHDVAMTGEITLRGRVLPIGGLKEKLLAAARGGIKTVLIPEDNAKDLTEISDAIKGGMDIIPVARLDDVISKALVRPPVPIVWEEDTKVPVKPDGAEASDEAPGGLTAH